MKRKHLLCLLIFGFLLQSIPSISQNYYVVIGAFRKETNAKKFTDYARSKFLEGQYNLNKKNKIFYVFILKTGDRSEALTKTLKMQTESEFTDTWAYKGFLGDDKSVAIVKIDEPAEQPAVIPIIEDTPVEIVKNTEPEKIETTEKDSVVAVSYEIPKGETPILKPKGKLFKFIVNSPDGIPVAGEVHAVNRQLGKDFASFKSNEYVDVQRMGANKPITIVCALFGYKEVEKQLDYNDPSVMEGAVKDSTGAWVIPFTLETLAKGDASVMYHVAFYKDAVVMLPQSKNEIDQLGNLLISNSEYKITVHAHCNGTFDRKIIALGKKKNYFNVNGSQEVKGSAKELTKLRAEAIQSYLADMGIESKRIKIYAWGGTDMLVDQNNPSAKLNDRIEIEIMKQ